MSHLGSLLVLTLIGAAEWSLAIRRAIYAARGARWRCSIVVFAETMLALYVLRAVVVDSSWMPALGYALGGSVGAFLAARR